MTRSSGMIDMMPSAACFKTMQSWEDRFMTWADVVGRDEYGVLSGPDYVRKHKALGDYTREGYADNLAYNVEVYKELRARYIVEVEHYVLQDPNDPNNPYRTNKSR